MSAPQVHWADGRDWQAGGATAREAIDRSPYRDQFMRAAAKFAAKANRHETVHVYWWSAPFVYIEVRDSRKHYPCNARALVSFDLGNGKFASPASERSYTFARQGWATFTDTLAGTSVPRYTECADPARQQGCPLPPRPAPGDGTGGGEVPENGRTAGQPVTPAGRQPDETERATPEQTEAARNAIRGVRLQERQSGWWDIYDADGGFAGRLFLERKRTGEPQLYHGRAAGGAELPLWLAEKEPVIAAVIAHNACRLRAAACGEARNSAGESASYPPAKLGLLIRAAGKLWNSTGGLDPNDVLSGVQREALGLAAALYRAGPGRYPAEKLDLLIRSAGELWNDGGQDTYHVLTAPESGSLDLAAALYRAELSLQMGSIHDPEPGDRKATAQ